MIHTYETAIAAIAAELSLQRLDICVCEGATAGEIQSKMIRDWASSRLGDRIQQRFSKYINGTGISSVSGFGFADEQDRAAVIYVNSDFLPKRHRENVGTSFVVGHEFAHIFRALSPQKTSMEALYPELLADKIDVYDFPNTLEETRADLLGWVFELVIGHEMSAEQIQNLHSGLSADTYAAGIIAARCEHRMRELARAIDGGEMTFMQAFSSISDEVLHHQDELKTWRNFLKIYYSIDARERNALAFEAGYERYMTHLEPGVSQELAGQSNPLRPNPFLPADKDHLRLTENFLNCALRKAEQTGQAEPFVQLAKTQNLNLVLNRHSQGWCADRLLKCADIWQATGGDVQRVRKAFVDEPDTLGALKGQIENADPNYNVFFNVAIEGAEIRYPLLRSNFLEAAAREPLLGAICETLPEALPADLERALFRVQSICEPQDATTVLNFT